MFFRFSDGDGKKGYDSDPQKTSRNLGQIHFSDFGAPIEIAVEVMALGNVVHVDLLMLKDLAGLGSFFLNILFGSHLV